MAMRSEPGPGDLPETQPPMSDKPLVVYFGFDADNFAVISRISAFQHAGARVLGLTYRRSDFFNHVHIPKWENIPLGELTRLKYLRRLRVMLRAPWIIWANRKKIAEASLFHARNVDMAVLALLARFLSGSKAPFVYEVRDVLPTITGNGRRARALRWLERRVLARTQILDVSSPGFIENYFVPVQGYRGEWFLSENKIHGSILREIATEPSGEVAAKIDAMKRGRLVVGAFSAFRCVRSLEMMAELSDKLPLLVYLRGIPPRAMGTDGFKSFVAQHPNVVYDGEFQSPRDLAELYGAIDIAWGFDFSSVDANSAWLLPRRLYEGAYYGVPLLTAAGTQTGRKVEELGIGWTIENPGMESIEKFFAQITPEEVARVKAHVASLPRELFCEEDDTGNLLRAAMRTSAVRTRGLAR